MDNKTVVDGAQEIAWNTKREEIKKLLSEDTSDMLARRHKIGVAVVELKNEDMYGYHAVERLADDLGYDKSTLYEYADVAEAWPAKAFSEVCGRKTTKGMPITFSHLVELTDVDNPKRRAKLLDEVFAKSLSVRALREKIGGQSKKVVRAAGATKPRTFAALFNQVDVAVAVLADWKTSLPEMCKAASASEIAGTKVRLEMQRAMLDKMIAILVTEAVPTSPLSRPTNGQPEV
jgi:hypothetical protein